MARKRRKVEREWTSKQLKWLRKHSKKPENLKFVTQEKKDHAGLADKLLSRFRAKFPDYPPDGKTIEDTLREVWTTPSHSRTYRRDTFFYRSQAIRRWSIQHFTTRTRRKAKKHATKKLTLDVPKPRVKRSVGGLDAFSKSDAAPPVQMIVEDGKVRPDVGTHRKMCKRLWDKLPEQKKKEYIQMAKKTNVERAEEQDDDDDDSDSDV